MHELIQEFLDTLSADRGCSQNTLSAYRNDLTQLAGYLAAPPPEDHLDPVNDWSQVTADHLSVWLIHLRGRQYAASTIARKTAAAKSFTAWLKAKGVQPTDLSLGLVAPRVDRYKPHAISAEDVDRLVAQPRDQVRASRNGRVRPEVVRDWAMLEVLYSTGMRVSELVSLDVQHWDPATGRVTCTSGRNRSRALPVSPNAAVPLQHYLEVARPRLATTDHPALFLNHRGQRLTRQGFWLILKTYADSAGIENVTPHTLRHSFAAHALAGGASVHDVQERLGHVSISTTRVYQQIAHDPSKVNAIIGGLVADAPDGDDPDPGCAGLDGGSQDEIGGRGERRATTSPPRTTA